jgi:thioredoxin 1
VVPTDSADPFHLPVLRGGEVERLLELGERPLLLDFFATWCGPCAWIIPTLNALRGEYGDRLDVFKLDVDESPGLAERFRIGSVPTLILFQAGMEVDRSVGVEPERVRSMVERVLRVGLDRDEAGEVFT